MVAPSKKVGEYPYKSLTTAKNPPRNPRNLSALLLRRDATAPTTAITSQYGVHVTGHRALSTKRSNKTRVAERSPQLQTTMNTGDGMDVAGKSLDLTAIVTTETKGLEERCGHCPAETLFREAVLKVLLNTNQTIKIKARKWKIEVRILQIQAKNLQGQAGTLQDQARMPDGIQLLKANMKTLKLQIKETNLKRSLFIRMS